MLMTFDLAGVCFYSNEMSRDMKALMKFGERQVGDNYFDDVQSGIGGKKAASGRSRREVVKVKAMKHMGAHKRLKYGKNQGHVGAEGVDRKEAAGATPA